MSRGTVHIVGAGLAGLSAAVRLAGAGEKVVVYELARHAGGRCRSYFEPALDLTLDNGNHLLLSANGAALAFLRTIGSEDKLVGPSEAEFAFADLASGQRWLLHPNNGRLPWWVFLKRRRAPASPRLSAPCSLAARKAWPETPRGHRLRGPAIRTARASIFLAALNTDPAEASASLAGAIMRETLASGGRACRPLIAQQGLGPAFVDPALSYLERNGTKIRCDHQLRKLDFAGDRVEALNFGEPSVKLAAGDAVILAVPGSVARLMLPGVATPTTYRSIVNAHFKQKPPPGFPQLLGVINGTAEWLSAFPTVFPRPLAPPIAGSRPRARTSRKDLGRHRQAHRRKRPLAAMGHHQRRRATLRRCPRELKRLTAATKWPNLFSPATGQPRDSRNNRGAIRSGNAAAGLALDAGRSMQGSSAK
jgi:hypothetical protein